MLFDPFPQNPDSSIAFAIVRDRSMSRVIEITLMRENGSATGRVQLGIIAGIPGDISRGLRNARNPDISLCNKGRRTSKSRLAVQEHRESEQECKLLRR